MNRQSIEFFVLFCVCFAFARATSPARAESEPAPARFGGGLIALAKMQYLIRRTIIIHILSSVFSVTRHTLGYIVG